jgi:hypothetical protein
MNPGDRLVCAFVSPTVNTGVKFTDWPLHVTIVPWFRSHILSDELAIQLEDYLKTIKPFEATSGPAKKFGYKKDKLANIIVNPGRFVEIENIVRRTLKTNDSWLVDESTRQKREYTPHITVQKSGRLETGDDFFCDRLFIVEQKGSHKEVSAMVRLNR